MASYTAQGYIQPEYLEVTINYVEPGYANPGYSETSLSYVHAGYVQPGYVGTGVNTSTQTVIALEELTVTLEQLQVTLVLPVVVQVQELVVSLNVLPVNALIQTIIPIQEQTIVLQTLQPETLFKTRILPSVLDIRLKLPSIFPSIVNNSLFYNSFIIGSNVKELVYGLGSNSHKVFSILYNQINRAYIDKSFETELPTWPVYLDGATQFWEPQQLEYLGTSKGSSTIQQSVLAEPVVTKLSYKFIDIPNKTVLHNGPVNLNDITIDKSKTYQVLNNLQILKVNENYFCYTIIGSSSYGEILFKPAPLEVDYDPLHLAEYNFVMNFPTNRAFNLLSKYDPQILTSSSLGGTPSIKYSNDQIAEDVFVEQTGGNSITVDPANLVLASTIFTFLVGGENIYYEGTTGFYYFDILPTQPFIANPVISLADAINGDYSTDVTLVAIPYIPNSWTLKGSPIIITSANIMYHPAAVINRVSPVVVKTLENSIVIPTTTSEAEIAIDREEFKLAGYIIVNGVDKWATMTWKSAGLYIINSLSSIDDLSKLSTKELTVVKYFNKYL